LTLVGSPLKVDGVGGRADCPETLLRVVGHCVSR
jgi:hypothetical protein